MRKKIATGFLLVLIPFLPGFVFAGNDVKDHIRLGMSSVNITPDKPVMMSGYGARGTPSVGVHDSLYASAFYFTEEKIRTLLITADLLWFPTDFIDELKALISSKMDIPAKNIMLVAVHNHGGPSIGYRDPESVKEYTEVLKGKLVSLATEASKNPQPFRMGIGKGRCTKNVSRRDEFTKGEIWLGKNPDGPCDHELDVIKFESLDHTPLGILINWSCHGTATGDSNYLITGDWPGSAARYIKKQIGSDVIIGVTAGASGDIDPIYGPGNDFRKVDAIGFQIGNETMNVLSKIETYPVKNLQATDTLLIFPGKKPFQNHFPQSSYEPGPDTEIRLTVLKVENLVLAGISGELFAEIGMEIKKQSPYSNTVILTHCNGSCGYICTDSAFVTGGYEVKVTRLLPGVEKPLIKKVIELIHFF